MIQLLCTVRNCRLPLERQERRFVCPSGHSFDIARGGYINLLQPQDRRSRTPGDSAAAVAARRRLHDRGLNGPLHEAILAMVPPGPLLDVGCGEGSFLGQVRSEAHGVDISAAAIELAAKRCRTCTLVIANADRFLPWADGSFSTVTSITARTNRDEFARVLATSGRLIIALPAPDDLLELRTAILGAGIERDRTPRAIEELSGSFVLERREHVRHKALLDPAAIGDVLTATYRGMRKQEQQRLGGIQSMDVTFSHDLLLFRR